MYDKLGTAVTDTRKLTSISQSNNPNASENVHMNWDIPAHLQSVLRRWMSGEGGGGAMSSVMGATAAATGRERRGGIVEAESQRWAYFDFCRRRQHHAWMKHTHCGFG